MSKTSHDKCDLCMVNFKQKNFQGFTEHIQNIHTIEELQSLEKKSEETEKRFSCEKCGHSFMTENIQKYHLQYSHREDKRRDLQCEMCEESFVWSRDRARVMREHMRLSHQVTSASNNDTVVNFMKIFNELK